MNPELGKKLLIAAGILVGVIALIVAFLPQILNLIGLHPHYERADATQSGSESVAGMPQ
jgi:hypothetical protein